jgi:Protein of unknown function (DUF3984)
MTPAGAVASKREEGAIQDSQQSLADSTSPSTRDYSAIEPDWADPQTQAEIAADLELELADELEDDGQSYSDDGDRYGALDFEGQGIEDDEREVQQAVRSRGFGVGQWIDGVVDVFLKMDEGDEDQPESTPEQTHLEGQEAEDRGQDEKSTREERDDLESDDDMEPAPANPKSRWEDVSWFARLVLRTAKS